MRREIGGRVVTRPLDILDYTSQVNRRDIVLNDIWGLGRYSFEDWIPNVKDEFFRSEQQ